MWNDKDITLTNFYGMQSPDPKYMQERMEKIKEVIEKMGDKYCLAKPVEKKKSESREWMI